MLVNLVLQQRTICIQQNNNHTRAEILSVGQCYFLTIVRIALTKKRSTAPKNS